jgi:hypothetical protein
MTNHVHFVVAPETGTALATTLKTVYVSPRSRALNALLRKARGANLVLRTTDGVEFVLAEIDDFNREMELTRGNQRLMAFLDARGRKMHTVSSDEVRSRLT